MPCSPRPAHVLILVLSLVPAGARARAEPAPSGGAQAAAARKPVAVLVADWVENSHPEVLFTRLFQTYTRDGKGPPSRLAVASVFRDRPTCGT